MSFWKLTKFFNFHTYTHTSSNSKTYMYVLNWAAIKPIKYSNLIQLYMFSHLSTITRYIWSLGKFFIYAQKYITSRFSNLNLMLRNFNEVIYANIYGSQFYYAPFVTSEMEKQYEGASFWSGFFQLRSSRMSFKEFSFNLAIKYLSINFHNNMYMNKTFHLPSYICMCFNPLSCSHRSYVLLLCVYECRTHNSVEMKITTMTTATTSGWYDKRQLSLLLTLIIHVHVITRPFKVIFLCRTANFYRAKDDGIINQKFPCGKIGRICGTREFFRNAASPLQERYVKKFIWRVEWMTVVFRVSVWNSLKISAY